MNTNATNTDTQIHSRALLVWLTISTWTARKYDKKISEKVNSEYSATSDAGRYNKFLLPGDCASYKALITLAGSIRAEHYANTLAWSDEGWRLLPTANYLEYTKTYRARQAELWQAIDTFANDYPMMRDRARHLLNGMYRDEDYPSVQDIRHRFALDVQYSPVPAIGDIRVDLSGDQVSAIEQSINDRVNGAIKIAVNDSWQRLYDVVAKISDRLSQPDAIFRDSLITNARDVCASLQRLNVTNDPKLEAMRQRVLSELTYHDPDILRDRAPVRSKVADKAQAIIDSMKGLYDVTVTA